MANRLGVVLDQIIHPDQTNCVPGRRIADNISFVRDVLDNSKVLFDFGLISIDQKKAFDRVEHKYLWSVLAAFGFSSDFISMIKVMYCDVESILKINGDLCSPFKVLRGVRQGCAFSGMLYTLAIEPLLNKLRIDMCGLQILNCVEAVKLSAYADDVVVLISNQNYVNVMLQTLDDFRNVSSAKVNWQKSEAIIVGNWLNGEPILPAGLKWIRDSFKYLGVFLGNENAVKKFFEGALEKVKGRLDKWNFLVPKMSYKGRILIINNLVASTLWHRLSCIDPPVDLLFKIQSCLVDFFWDKLHWVPKSVIYLPKEEGGFGLVHLQSRTAAFRIQFIQRLLAGSENSNWKKATFSLLRGFEGMGLDGALFWLDPQKLKLSKFPVFYRNLFKVWTLFKIPKERTVNSLYWLLQEPLIFGSRLALTSELRYSVTEENLLNSGLLTIGQVLEVAGVNFSDAIAKTEKLGMRSFRLVARALDKWKTALSEKELQLLLDNLLGLVNPDYTDSFPDSHNGQL